MLFVIELGINFMIMDSNKLHLIIFKCMQNREFNVTFSMYLLFLLLLSQTIIWNELAKFLQKASLIFFQP